MIFRTSQFCLSDPLGMLLYDIGQVRVCHLQENVCILLNGGTKNVEHFILKYHFYKEG